MLMFAESMAALRNCVAGRLAKGDRTVSVKASLVDCDRARAAGSPPIFLALAYYFVQSVLDMSVALPRLQEVDLRELFSFDKLRESGRVSVMTTEEFLEKEAFPGNLGIQPSEDVMRLKVLVRNTYAQRTPSSQRTK